MPLVRHGEIVDDQWLTLEQDEAPSPGSAVIVSLERFLAEAEAFASHDGGVAVAVPNDADIADLAPHLDRLDMVVLALPALGDGRAFSQARLLRHAYSYRGELRLCGCPTPDQVAFLRQCGFDSFEVDERFDIDTIRRVATAMTLTYQRGYQPSRGFGPAEIFVDRRRARFSATETKGS